MSKEEHVENLSDLLETVIRNHGPEVGLASAGLLDISSAYRKLLKLTLTLSAKISAMEGSQELLPRMLESVKTLETNLNKNLAAIVTGLGKDQESTKALAKILVSAIQRENEIIKKS